MTDSYLPTDQVERIQKSKGVHIEKNTSMRVFILRMNNKKPPFDNVNARKCFAHAFNYDGFIQEILKGYAERNPAPHAQQPLGLPARTSSGYDYDLKKAKEFCDKAKAEGAPIGRPIEIHIQSQLEQTNQAAQLFQSDLAPDRHQPQDRLRHLGQHHDQHRQARDHARTCGSTGSRPISSIRRTGSARCTTASSTAPGRRRPGTRTRRSTSSCARRAASSSRPSAQPLYEEATRLIVADSPDIWVYNTVELARHHRPGQGLPLLARRLAAARCAGCSSRSERASAVKEPGRWPRRLGSPTGKRRGGRTCRPLRTCSASSCAALLLAIPSLARPARPHLLADPGGAGRPGRGARRRERDARADRRDPPAVRLRPAAARAVRRLSRPGRALRFRRERLFAPAGRARHQAAPAGDPGADLRGAAASRRCSASRSAPSPPSTTTAGPTRCCGSSRSAASRSPPSGSRSSCSCSSRWSSTGCRCAAA